MSKRKTVWPGVREISPVSIYGEVYGGKDLSVTQYCVNDKNQLGKFIPQNKILAMRRPTIQP